jgi:hypothetical protein
VPRPAVNGIVRTVYVVTDSTYVVVCGPVYLLANGGGTPLCEVLPPVVCVSVGVSSGSDTYRAWRAVLNAITEARAHYAVLRPLRPDASDLKGRAAPFIGNAAASCGGSLMITAAACRI